MVSDEPLTGETASFGPFRLTVTEKLLTKGDEPVLVGGRALDILITLVERAGQIVSRRELLDRVWPDVLVEEANLPVHVASLRKALGDGQDESRYVAKGLSRSRRCRTPAVSVAVVMTQPGYSVYRFPPDVIQRAVWMYLRFTLSYRDVEDLLAERGIEVSYETIRRWVSAFGPMIARRLRAQRPAPHRRWHLDEMFVRIGAKQMYLWRAVDAEGEVLEVLVQARRDAAAARKLMRKLLKKQGIAPNQWVTDKCPAYGAALRDLRRFADASASCNGSRRPPRRSGSCRCTPRPTTPSTSAVTSSPPARTAAFAPRRLRHGGMRLASRPEPGECRPIAATFDNATSPREPSRPY